MGIQFGHTGVKIAHALIHFSGTIIYSGRSILKFHCAVRKFIHTIDQFFRLGQKRAHTVIQIRRTVDQLIHRIGQFLHRSVQIQRLLRTICSGSGRTSPQCSAAEFIRVDLVKKLGGSDRYSHAETEVYTVCRDLHIVRDRHLIRCDPQIFGKSRERKSDDYRSASVIDDLAVGYRHIGEYGIIHQHTRQHRKRYTESLLLAVDLLRDGRVVLILIADRDASALPDQFLRRDRRSVEEIRNLHIDGKFFFNIALIVDIVIGGIPYTGIRATHREAFSILQDRDIREFGDIFHTGLPGSISDPVADDDLLDRSFTPGDHIYCFLFKSTFRGDRPCARRGIHIFHQITGSIA